MMFPFAHRIGRRILPALALVCAAAAQPNVEPDTATELLKQMREMARPAAGSSSYVLNRGDEVEIRAFLLPELNQTVRVRPDGRISLLFLDDVSAAGLTVTELRAHLTEAYAHHFRDPRLAVVVRSFANQSVFVGGEVNQPGLIPLDPALTVAAAVFRAGGFRDTARLDEVIVLRDNGKDGLDRIVVNLDNVLAQGVGDTLLRPADVVYVPKSTLNVYVAGEVVTPGLVTIQGRMSLVSAIAKAGGPRNTAALRSLVLLRDSGGKPTSRKVDLQGILVKNEPDILLQPYDVVYIPKSTIAKMDQFVEMYIRQLLPVGIHAGFSYLIGGGF